MTGAELKEWRRGTGLNQAEIAMRMGVSERTYQGLEAQAEIKWADRHAIDIMSIHLAIETRDAGVLTKDAFATFQLLEPLVTPEVRAQFVFEQPALLLSPEEMAQLETFQTALGHPLDDGQILVWVSQLRSAAANRSVGQVQVEGAFNPMGRSLGGMR